MAYKILILMMKKCDGVIVSHLQKCGYEAFVAEMHSRQYPC